MAGVLQTVLPVYFDFRISVAQTKPVDKDDKQSIQESKNDFTLKLFCDQTEVSVQTDDLETLQGLLRELRRSHLIAQDDNFYAGGSSHRWIQYYTTTEDDQKDAEQTSGSILTMDEFIASTKNPLAKYFLQSEENQPSLPSAGPRLDLGTVKENWVEKEMRARENDFTEYGFMHAFVGTWNVNGRNAPEKLDSWLKVEGEVQPDIYVLCFQELDLSAEAYIVLDGSKEEEWTRAIAESLGSGYQKVMSKQLIGLLIVMYVAKDHAKYIREVTAHSAGVGIMGMLGNKGGVSIRIRYKDSYFCFVDSHLAADTNQIDRRNQDYQEICRRLTFPSASPYDITKSPAGNAALGVANKMVSVFDCDHTIWAGDLNYRLGLPEDQVKNHLKTNDYEALMKHDQLTAQRSLLKAFSDFEEHPIYFHPTYKYDVGTSTWDSSEKRRVPAYTDRILWRTKDSAKDSAEALFYRSHMDMTISDHKPVSAYFKLKVKTLLHAKQAEVHQAIVRELDKYENECMPDATISSSNIVFEEVRYLEPKKTSIVIKNTGQFPAQYRFKPKLQDERFCKPWTWANPPVGMIMPGESAKLHITVMVDNESAPLLNTGKEKMDDILILHLEHGKDYFISVSGSYVRTCFGNSLEWLSRLDRPIRLWNPEEDEDEDEDDTATLYDPYSVLGTKSSMGSIKDSAAMSANSGSAKQVKNAKSLDSLSDKNSIGRKNNIETVLANTQISDEKASVPVKKQKPARQLSLPKDLWRIVDFIYKYGFSVDNLFLLSGDQSTMSYIRECLDTGEEFDLRRLLGKPAQQDTEAGAAEIKSDNAATSKQLPQQNTPKDKAKLSNKDGKDTDTQNEKDATHPVVSSSLTLPPRGSPSDLKPQIARPVSIMNGIPPKAATFGLGENRGVHSMAEVLLRFLESLREPVVPTEMYYRALEVAGHQQAAYGLLDLMPPVHVNVFVYITSFLRELILVGGNHLGGSQDADDGAKEGTSVIAGSNNTGSNNVSIGSGANSSNNRVLQSNSGSIYNGAEPPSGGVRAKRDDEDFRVAKLASVFSSVMLRPPPGAERLSEIEALKRKTFLMQFLQEPAEEEGLGGPGGLGGPPPPSSAATATAVLPPALSMPGSFAVNASVTGPTHAAQSENTEEDS
ncbi:Endonuclease/exonuclease/phosphatase [Gamsiella multidivaricata]|uniref:Endonuclease/exonuclease/phosphatase n=1 Tax=Gamsiella multidivaricata TaxID=101098 RepID=UPI0022206A85|nr:Endonuclease/exonuclease/phosphatase [Gamsiella multidivaricata]KAI7828526.1 Endonuclease/exonuclease/phosphatase [Gamsiella multidivaricata]